MSGMNWEKSKALTTLKRDFLCAFFARNNSFFLTGGSALGIFYLQHRYSYDLDFVIELVPQIDPGKSSGGHSFCSSNPARFTS